MRGGEESVATDFWYYYNNITFPTMILSLLVVSDTEPKNLRSRKVSDLSSQFFIFQIRITSAIKGEMQESKKWDVQIQVIFTFAPQA